MNIMKKSLLFVSYQQGFLDFVKQALSHVKN